MHLRVVRLPLPPLIFTIACAATLAELVVISLGPPYAQLRWFTKPLILSSLLVWWLWIRTEKRLRWGIGLALLFSLAGDVLLLIEGELYFQAGLGAFLLAQLLYASTFLQTGAKQHGLLKRQPAWAATVLLYAIGFGSVLWPHLGALKIPVVLYILAISGMALSVVHRGGRVPAPSFKLGLIGMLLFLASDSLLGYQTFVKPLPLGELAVMFTYALAQMGLVSAAYQQAVDLPRR